jgi:hypothetical protein
MNQAPPPIWTEEPISYFVLFALIIVRFALIPSAFIALGMAWFGRPEWDRWKRRLSLLAITLTVFDHQLTRLMINPPRSLPIVPWIGWAALIAFGIGLVLTGVNKDVATRVQWSKIWSTITVLYATLLLLTWGR